MKSAQSLINLQQVPGDTDFDDRPRSEEDRVREKDKQIIIDDQDKSVNDSLYQKEQKPIGQVPPQTQRNMRAMSTYERRIF